MSQQNIKYFSVLEGEEQAVELTLSQLDTNSLNSQAIYRVDMDINDMPVSDLLLYLPAYHINPTSLIRKAGISLYSGTVNL